MRCSVSFGIVSIDWSNAKQLWANSQPMNCQELMVEQSKILKQYGQSHPSNNLHVFGYANLVKALPWFTPIREKILDPQYSQFFLKFDPNVAKPHVPRCTDGQGCSDFYHDQEQTPGYPSGDGNCTQQCDCGNGLPCGEYLFDHRNGTQLRDFILNDYLYSPSLLGSGYLDGLFIDDFWCSNGVNGTGYCQDPVPGPSEIDPYSQVDMGLSDADEDAITKEWLITMQAAQQKILDENHFTWSLINGQANANAAPYIVTSQYCTSTLRYLCSASNPYLSVPLIYGVTSDMSSIQQQTAIFLLIRGDYAWMGWGEWGMEWPGNESVPWPSLWDTPNLQLNEKPLDAFCAETGPQSGVFVRRVNSQVTVQMDCNSWTAQFKTMDIATRASE